VSSVHFVTCCIPDRNLAFTVGYLRRFLEVPKEDHLTAVKRVLRYMAGTCDCGLYYTRHDENKRSLVGYSNAKMAGDIDTRTSTSGVIFFLNNNPITWQATKQKVVALSSCEAKYIALRLQRARGSNSGGSSLKCLERKLASQSCASTTNRQ
jgi:hypothetical protein